MRSGFKCLRIAVIILMVVSANGLFGQTNSPGSDAAKQELSSRVLRPNDQISVTVYQEPDLDVKLVAIDARGYVPLPLLGAVKVGGLTVEQATAHVRDLYDKDYIVKPQVSINVEVFARLRFTVLGQVQRPGTYDYPANESLNLLECIATAGGYARLGSPSKVKVQRIIDDQPKIFNLDAGEMARDKKNKPFQILPDDIITVGERVF